jgi:xylan 1,4-beta-xylosidase
VDPHESDRAPDTVRLGLDVDGEFTALAELDGRYLSTEVAGGFTGRVIGMYAARGTVHFDWFEYRHS